MTREQIAEAIEAAYREGYRDGGSAAHPLGPKYDPDKDWCKSEAFDFYSQLESSEQVAQESTEVSPGSQEPPAGADKLPACEADTKGGSE